MVVSGWKSERLGEIFMLDKLGILLVEESNGRVAVQLYADPEAMAPIIKEMNGKLTDDPKRVTYLKLKYKEGKVEIYGGDAKMIPVPIEDGPDGIQLGVGPVKI